MLLMEKRPGNGCRRIKVAQLSRHFLLFLRCGGKTCESTEQKYAKNKNEPVIDHVTIYAGTSRSLITIQILQKVQKERE
jgi:hypothetical protein